MLHFVRFVQHGMRKSAYFRNSSEGLRESRPVQFRHVFVEVSRASVRTNSMRQYYAPPESSANRETTHNPVQSRVIPSTSVKAK